MSSKFRLSPRNTQIGHVIFETFLSCELIPAVRLIYTYT
jgi:hypothetical protein